MSNEVMEETLQSKVSRRIMDQCSVRGLDGGSLALYVTEGVEPGGFLRAVLENNLKEAAAHADLHNQHRLFDWAYILYNYVPSDCQGNREKVEAWLRHRGMFGLRGPS